MPFGAEGRPPRLLGGEEGERNYPSRSSLALDRHHLWCREDGVIIFYGYSTPFAGMSVVPLHCCVLRCCGVRIGWLLAISSALLSVPSLL